jgi:radical SAM superfamily enzyme YgiQ (UPF0313 family)
MSNRLHRAARERLAQEQGACQKDWGGRIPVALVYPNVYSVAMANLGFLAVYGLLNRHPDVVCERAFFPDWEEREELARTGTRPFSLETQKPLNAFEIIAFSLSYENDYPNVAALLSMAGIPAERCHRSPDSPLLIAGGPAIFLNPEPMAGIIDVFVLGEAEDALDEVLELYRKRRGPDHRESFVCEVPSVQGVYVPALYEPRYEEDGSLAAFEPRKGAPEKVERRWIRDLDRCRTESTVFTPEAELSGIHLVEVGRGCSRRCRFCSTGFIYRPVRYRSLEALQSSLEAGIAKGRRLGLVCASLGDYPELDSLCQWLLERGGKLSAPSLRLDKLTDKLLEALRASGQKTVTLAPEAGSERLRRILHKAFDDEEILSAADRLAEGGIFNVRLYFMVGLPGEGDEDVEAIIDLTKRIRHRFLRVAKDTARMGEITLSVNPFVPKPWSAFQWCAMAEEELLKERLKKIRRSLQKEPNINVTHGLAKWAYLQALFGRGDRRVLPFVLEGASADTDWRKVFRTTTLNPDFFVHRERRRDELFPWDFIDHGIPKEALYKEYERRLSCSPGPKREESSYC